MAIHQEAAYPGAHDLPHTEAAVARRVDAPAVPGPHLRAAGLRDRSPDEPRVGSCACGLIPASPPRVARRGHSPPVVPSGQCAGSGMLSNRGQRHLSGQFVRSDARKATPRMAPTRVIIVDDHDLFRTGLASLMDDEDDIQVVAQASGGRMGVRLAAELNPDVILMDLRMPDMTGPEATRAIVSPKPSGPRTGADGRLRGSRRFGGAAGRRLWLPCQGHTGRQPGRGYSRRSPGHGMAIAQSCRGRARTNPQRAGASRAAEPRPSSTYRLASSMSCGSSPAAWRTPRSPPS